MSIYSMFFSPTGGTKKVMDILSNNLSVDIQIDLSKIDTDYSKYKMDEKDACLIGVPSFGGRVPSIALERMSKIQVDGTLAIIVVVFGNRAYDDTLLELKDEATACGFVIGSAIAAVAEHSIIRQFGKARPDMEDVRELNKFGEQIKELILNRQNIKELKIPGNTPYKEYKGVPMKPTANKSCNSCGICAQKCPVNAIPKDNPLSTDKGKCISCMRCVSVCSQQVRTLNKAMVFAASQGMKKSCSTRKSNEIYI